MDKNQQELIYIHPFINDCKRSVPKSRTLKKPTDPDSCGPPFEKVKVPKQGNSGPTKGPAGARRCPNFPVRGLRLFQKGDPKTAPKSRFWGFIRFVSRDFSLFGFPFSPFSTTLLILNLLQSPSYSQDQSDFSFRSKI